MVLVVVGGVFLVIFVVDFLFFGFLFNLDVIVLEGVDIIEEGLVNLVLFWVFILDGKL